MKLSTVYLSRARQKGIIGLTILAVSVAVGCVSARVILSEPAGGLVLLAVALAGFAYALDTIVDAFSIARAGWNERNAENNL